MITPSDVPSRWRKKSPNGFRRRLRLFSCSMGRLKESSPVILLLLLFPLLLHQSLTKVLGESESTRFGFCSSQQVKSFNEDKFLDQHFATRHFNLLNTTGTKCLADLCGALHCDFVLSSKKAKSKCNPAAAAKNRHL
ncbi:BnaC09g14260D [Brassica napus]|uniref:BnaC09g14260D protein n=1 Tax=Brassica napus TaxID=3708 RepID=A0A078ICL6_BRANA|nr:BnaC09g14260D [Brassica napus]